MKVRNKSVSGTCDTSFFVIEEAPHFYICHSTAAGYFAASKDIYEPIPEPTEQWRDVHDSVWFQFNHGFDENGNVLEGPFKARFDVVRKKA